MGTIWAIHTGTFFFLSILVSLKLEHYTRDNAILIFLNGRTRLHGASNKHKSKIDQIIHRGSYMSAHVLLNLLNKLEKRDKMRGLSSILSLFRNEFNKFNNTRARM